LVKRVDGKIVTQVYRKPTDSGLYLQFDSNHPGAVKNGIVNTLLHRAKTHCSDEIAYNNEVKKVEDILASNKYPIRLVRQVKNMREKSGRKVDNTIKPEATVSLPYVPRLSEKIKKIASGLNIRAVFTSRNTIRSNLVRFKPRMQPIIKKGVIYSIPCECGKSYIGETGRTLQVRLDEHRRSVKKRDPDVSKLCEHYYNTGHRFLWDEAKVIGHEETYKARKVHEAMEIFRGRGFVVSTPSAVIDPVWRPLMRKFRPPPVHETVRRSRRLLEKREREENNIVVTSHRSRGASSASSTRGHSAVCGNVRAASRGRGTWKGRVTGPRR
jgi:hypothetical protein